MNYIECPEVLTSDEAYDNIAIFLGGGISNCPDWQTEVVAQLSDVEGLTLVNPRRSNFDITDSAMSGKQIIWEHDHLDRCLAATFWFPSETLCPITLFELGVHATLGKKLFVGCHLEYKRRFDVIEQLRLINPDIIVFDSISDLVIDIKAFVQYLQPMRS